MNTVLVVSTAKRFKALMAERTDIIVSDDIRMVYQTKAGKAFTFCPNAERTKGYSRDVEVHVYPAGMEITPEDIVILRAEHDVCGVHYEHA